MSSCSPFAHIQSLLSSVMSNSKKEDEKNYFVGTQAIVGPAWKSYRASPFVDHDYSEPSYDMLTEFREAVASTGMNHFKFKLAPNACESYKLPTSSENINSLTELANVKEIAATLADSRFKWYHIWTYSWSLRKKLNEDFTEEQIQAEYDEIFALTTHLLQCHQNTGKVFMLGNWEGDWELLGNNGSSASGDVGHDLSLAPDSDRVDKYIKWATIRQKAVDDAKAALGASVAGVHVYFYIEFNFEKENYEDHPDEPGTPRPTILNSVAPRVNPDFLSYSSYKSTNRYMNHQGKWFKQTEVDKDFMAILDYAQGKLNPKSTDLTPVLGSMDKRVFIGEFSPLRKKEEDLHIPSASLVIKRRLWSGDAPLFCTGRVLTTTPMRCH